jgi:hypothetical protein
VLRGYLYANHPPKTKIEQQDQRLGHSLNRPMHKTHALGTIPIAPNQIKADPMLKQIQLRFAYEHQVATCPSIDLAQPTVLRISGVSLGNPARVGPANLRCSLGSCKLIAQSLSRPNALFFLRRLASCGVQIPLNKSSHSSSS